MNDLVVHSWHKCSLNEFVSFIYKKGSDSPNIGFVCNCSCVYTSTHKNLHKIQICLLKIREVNFLLCFNIDQCKLCQKYFSKKDTPLHRTWQIWRLTRDPHASPCVDQLGMTTFAFLFLNWHLNLMDMELRSLWKLVFTRGDNYLINIGKWRKKRSKSSDANKCELSVGPRRTPKCLAVV